MTNFENKIILGDCYSVLQKIPSASIDLVITDPPYDIRNTKAGGNGTLKDSIQRVQNDLLSAEICGGISLDFCAEIARVCKRINAYIFCNKIQILPYLKYFVDGLHCTFDILVWHKTNAVPTYFNKYLTDCEYCLYFRKGGFCKPANYDDGSTVFNLPTNAKDKIRWQHPTIKPLQIIKTLVKNSSQVGDLVLDPFEGSETTAVACKMLNRKFCAIEKNENFYKIACARVAEVGADVDLSQSFLNFES